MQQLQRAARGEPSFVLEEYFSGHTHAFGMFVDRFGAVKRQFSVDILGEMENGQLVLTEDFTFDGGERSKRVWRITPLGDGRYSGTADDVVGTAEGSVSGNCLRWSYDLNLKIGQREWRVRFDDIMLLQNDQVLLNRAQMSKWGITLGEVIISFHKEAERSESNISDAKPTYSKTHSRSRIDEETLAAVSA
ncbi:MAG: DUF3833 domain-containing protein [Pseudomonadota bacterium]